MRGNGLTAHLDFRRIHYLGKRISAKPERFHATEFVYGTIGIRQQLGSVIRVMRPEGRFQSHWIGSICPIISAVTVEIACVAFEADWIGLEEAAEIGRHEAVAIVV